MNIFEPPEITNQRRDKFVRRFPLQGFEVKLALPHTGLLLRFSLRLKTAARGWALNLWYLKKLN